MMSAFQSWDQCFLSLHALSEKGSFSLKEPSSLNIHADVQHQSTQIEYIKDGDAIKGIRVFCECGKELYLEFEYKKSKT